MRGPLTLLLALCLASGCGAALVIHREVPRPAAIPARAYPVVYVAASPDGASREIADVIARHLEGGGQARIVRVDATSLLAQAAEERVATLALLVTVTFHEELRTQMSSVPTTRCAPGAPCYGYPERMPVDVPVQVGDLLVRAFDPRSATELGRAVLHQEESEPSPFAAQLAVMDRLRHQAPEIVDVQAELVDVELDPTSDADGRAAIEDARAGRIHAARIVLEARTQDAALDAPTRAALLFDLGQLTRIDVDTSASDPVAEESARLASAEEAILGAIQLAPSERYERALVQLRAERTAREDVRAQQAAADTNFGTPPP